MNDKEFMLPLADPVVSAIYSDAEHAGLAAHSLIQATIGRCGETFGNIVSLTPQKVEANDPTLRGFRVDVQAVSDLNQYANKEAQLHFDLTLPQRNLMEAGQIYRQHSQRGTTHAEMVKQMPTVYAINILGHDRVYPGTEDLGYFYSAHVTIDQKPGKILIPQFGIFNLQLSQFPKAEPDFADPLYNWVCLLYTMQKFEKTPQEVLEMIPELKPFVEQDEGIRQFCQRYGYVTADAHVREQYHRWNMEQMRYAGEMEGAKFTGFEQGLERGLEQGRSEGIELGQRRGAEKALRDMAVRMLRANAEFDFISEITGFDEATLAELAERSGIEFEPPTQDGGMRMS